LAGPLLCRRPPAGRPAGRAAARRLAALLGAERYNAWYERRFPGEGLLSQYTWQEKHDRTEAVLERAAKLHAFEAPERAR